MLDGSMIYALLLAAISTNPCSAAQTQSDLNVCWRAQAARAESELATTHANAVAQLRKRGVEPASLEAVERSWTAARDATCAFETALYQGGSIAPMMASECVDRMTRQRTRRLQAMLAMPALPAKPIAPVSQPAGAQLHRILTALDARIPAASRKALNSAESAWSAYLTKACTLEGDDCLTTLTRERAAELEAGWIGEPLA